MDRNTKNGKIVFFTKNKIMVEHTISDSTYHQMEEQKWN